MSVAIIAGGKSRRFGSPKAMAEFRGKRLIDHALSLAKQLSDKVFVCCGPSPLPLDASTSQLPDLIPDCGPLGGLHAAMQACETKWLAIMPCDMPLLTANIYKKLFENCDTEKPIVAVSQSGLQPLVSVWPHNQKKNVYEQLKQKNFSIQEALRITKARKIAVSAGHDDQAFHNINTREDLQNLFQLPPFNDFS
ncbi:MAG: molybdenum cofactor guanylyltransferase [Calditrichota bacterium]